MTTFLYLQKPYQTMDVHNSSKVAERQNILTTQTGVRHPTDRAIGQFIWDLPSGHSPVNTNITHPWPVSLLPQGILPQTLNTSFIMRQKMFCIILCLSSFSFICFFHYSVPSIILVMLKCVDCSTSGQLKMNAVKYHMHAS